MEHESLSQEEFLEQAEHTLLKPETKLSALEQFLREAQALGVKRVCVSPSLISAAHHRLEQHSTRSIEIVSVVGFPSGAHTAEIKAAEAHASVEDGAAEVDMVINRALLGDWDALAHEIQTVKIACGSAALKVILETAALTDNEIIHACQAAQTAGADFVKTSTGFDPAGGASVHAVELMRQVVGGSLGIKASGGIRSSAMVKDLAAAGATRFGVSGTASILQDWPQPRLNTFTDQ